MKTIGILDFKKLVYQRLQNPNAFSGKTLVLWRARYTSDSIASRVIKECCVEHNKKTPDQQVWYKDSDFMFNSEDYTTIEEICDIKDMYGFKTSGILFNTGCFGVADFDDWFKFVNTHENKFGHLSGNWALIACAQEYKDHKYGEEDFADNCEIYALQPTIREWAEWVKPQYSPEVLQPMIDYVDYITTNGLIRETDFFGQIITNIDVFYLERLMNCIEREMAHNDLSKLSQLAKDSLLWGGPVFIEEEFFTFIKDKDY